jgi:hypothetical protein
MNLSHDAADFAERTYRLKREEIMREYHEKKRNLQFVSFTQSREDIRVQQLLPETMRALTNALVNSWFDAFDLEGKIPAHSDLAELDRKIENLFAGGSGFVTDALPVSITTENLRIEREVCEGMRLRAKRLELQRKREASVDTLKIRWHQLPKPTAPGTYRVPGVGDVVLSADDLKSFEEVGGDPWIELTDVTTFGGHSVRQYQIITFTPA